MVVATAGTWGWSPVDIGLTERIFGDNNTTFSNPNRSTGLTTPITAPTTSGYTMPSTTSNPVSLPSNGNVQGLSTYQAPAPIENTGSTSGGVDWSKGLTGEQVRALGLNPDTMIGTNGLYYNSNSGSGGTSALDSGYNDYFASLDAQMNGLGDQRIAQEGIANNTYNQGLNTANSALTQGQSSLESNRSKTLADLTDNLMQSWKQGNTMLGTRGASDSSAANQYSYALAKEGNRSRGNVQSQYDQNLFQLKNTYDTETKNLELQKNSQLQQISGWFAEAQNALRSQKGQAALQKSQQALSMAMQAAQQVQADMASKRSMLDQWATQHATNFSQLAQQLGVQGQFQTQAPTSFGSIGGVNQGNIGASTGYGNSSSTTKKDMFGNPISY